MKKNLYLVMCMMFVLTFTLSAQQPRMEKSKTHQNSDRKMGHRHTGMVTPLMRADRMASVVGLSDAEKLKVKELFEKEDANRVKRMDEVQKVKKEMKVKFEGDRKSNDAELEKIIGKEKFQKLADKRSEVKTKMVNQRKAPKQQRNNSPKKMKKAA